jgi:hypothetical protein
MVEHDHDAAMKLADERRDARLAEGKATEGAIDAAHQSERDHLEQLHGDRLAAIDAEETRRAQRRREIEQEQEGRAREREAAQEARQSRRLGLQAIGEAEREATLAAGAVGRMTRGIVASVVGRSPELMGRLTMPSMPVVRVGDPVEQANRKLDKLIQVEERNNRLLERIEQSGGLLGP